MARRVLLAVLLTSFVAMWVVALTTYGSLPARYPLHFDAAGVPDRFGTKSLLTWLAMPGFFSVLTAVFAGIAWGTGYLARRGAKFMNVPEKDAFLRLGEDARVQAAAPLADLGLAMPVALCLLSVYVQIGASLVARQEARTLPGWPVFLVLLYSFVALAISVVRTRKAVLRLSGGPG